MKPAGAAGRAKSAKAAKTAKNGKNAKVAKETKAKGGAKAKRATKANATAKAGAGAEARRKKKAPTEVNGFSVGDHVVYPAHGVGRITGIDERAVAEQTLQMFVVAFEKDKMTLMVPTDKVESAGMRRLSSKETMDAAITTLRGRARQRRVMWSRRAQEYEAKLNSGDPVSIAEVVRESAPQRRPAGPELQRAPDVRGGAGSLGTGVRSGRRYRYRASREQARGRPTRGVGAGLPSTTWAAPPTNGS